MNNEEARTLLALRLAEYRRKTYAELAALVGQATDLHEVRGKDGARYQIDIDIAWDGPAGADVRVLGAVDDAGWRACLPLTDSFIKAPDESFIGE